MLQKQFKIGRRPRIEQILKKGRRLAGDLFYFKYLPSARTFCRFSVIASKKISAKATERNLIRRRVYEALRRNWEAVGRAKAGKTCYDVVVLCSPPIAKSTYGAIEKHLLSSAKRLLA